ncbi:MAG: hypothetical protein HKO62_14390 [Gammaproteobacteria bacterium]|nr:hypothetical protein [Gammaproteobacteria bacterium]
MTRAFTVTVVAAALASAMLARTIEAPPPPSAPLASVLELVRERESDLPVPAGFVVRDLGARYGYYNPFTDRITVDDVFLAGADCARMQKLYEILVHEAWHRREPVRAVLAPWRHPHIDAAAAQRAALARPVIAACSDLEPG